MVNSLTNVLYDEDGYARARAAISLSQLAQATPEAMNVLIDALHAHNSSVRNRAAWSLSQLVQNNLDVQNSLIMTLRNDPDASVRSIAAESLGKSAKATPEMLNALLSALYSEDTLVRDGAAISLGQLAQVTPEVLNIQMITPNGVSASVQNRETWRQGK